MNEKYGERRLQVRCDYDKNKIHIQGVGTPTLTGDNPMYREYGMALELRAPPELTDWLREQEPTNRSPASGSMYYVQMALHHYAVKDTYQFMIFGSDLNHPEGAVMDMEFESPNVQALIKFVESQEPSKNMLVVFKSDIEPYSNPLESDE